MTMNYPQRTGKSTQRAIQNRDVNAANRVKTALELRAEMLTYDEIATRCGYATRDSARKAILREMDRTIVKSVNELRDTELHMLNIMHGKCWQRFQDEKNPYSYSEVDRLLRISERRCKLMGLDAKVDEVAVNMNYTKKIILEVGETKE